MTRNDDVDKEELRRRCLNVTEKHRSETIVLGKEAYKTSELGFKEFRTGKLMEEAFCKFGLKPEIGVSYTGCHVFSGPKGNGPRVAVMGELDCIMCDSHPDAAEGGMVYARGHNVQLANMYGVAMGILTSGIMGYLGGAVDLIAIPAEECMDYEYRNCLMSQGTAHYPGGGQELICRGGLDDTGMVLRRHMVEMELGKCYILDIRGNGFISKTVHFLGKVAHAGSAPEQRINALNTVELTMDNIHTLRETFRDEDKVRVGIVIKEGGGLVNVVPERATVEITVRAFIIDAMEDASHKVNRSMKAAAMALGGKVEICDCIGYPSLNTDHQIAQSYHDNMMAHERTGGDALVEDWETAGSTDLGDISQIMSCMYIWTGGIKGGLHTEDYRADDSYIAYIVPVEAMALTIIDLLWGEGAKGKEIIRDFRPALTKEEHLSPLKDHQVVDLYDASDL